MAKSKYEYVKNFEAHDSALLDTYMVVRLDGRGFTKMCDLHDFEKPNDKRAIDLMNSAAKVVMQEFEEIFLSYGQSDEYSFIFKREAELFERRKEKIISCLTSLFTSAYVLNFPKYFKGEELRTIPSFDGRLVCYPTLDTLKDYLRWRQVDCHINNLFNTTFWALVKKGGLSQKESEKKLKNTLSKEKNEILFKDFGINYSNEPAMFRKGNIWIRSWKADPEKLKKYEDMIENGNYEFKPRPPRKKQILELCHIDIIHDKFWIENFPNLY